LEFIDTLKWDEEHIMP